MWFTGDHPQFLVIRVQSLDTTNRRQQLSFHANPDMSAFAEKLPVPLVPREDQENRYRLAPPTFSPRLPNHCIS